MKNTLFLLENKINVSVNVSYKPQSRHLRINRTQFARFMERKREKAPRRRRQHIENRTSLTKLGEQYQQNGADEAKHGKRSRCRRSRRRTDSPHQDDVLSCSACLYDVDCQVSSLQQIHTGLQKGIPLRDPLTYPRVTCEEGEHIVRPSFSTELIVRVCLLYSN